MKTIIVDHDTNTELHHSGRFNNIIPILKAYGCGHSDIIKPKQIPEYLHSDHKIIYALTARIPKNGDMNDDRHWLDELATEIPTHIIELANKGLLHIAFFVGEIITITIEQILETVDKQLLLAGIKKESITVYIPNFHIHVLNVSHIKFISIFEMSYYQYLADSDIPKKDNIIHTVNLDKRNKKFTCLNHINKTHRLCIAASLYNSDRHLDGYFSYHKNDEFIIGSPNNIIDVIDTDNFISELPFLIDTSDCEIVNYHWVVKKSFFNNAYWNFVTESFFADHYAVTEKTFKPIANLQPFIIVGTAGSLKALRDMGYETFHSVINETYDVTENHDRRMKILINLTNRLVDMSDDEHIKMMTKIKPILEHNQRVFFKKTWRDFI